MPNLLIRGLIALAGLIVSARTHVTAAAAGARLDIPVLGVIALAVVLVAAAAVLWLGRQLMRDGLRLRPRMVEL